MVIYYCFFYFVSKVYQASESVFLPRKGKRYEFTSNLFFKALLVSAFINSGVLLRAQEMQLANQAPQTISPQAYEFTKFGDVPVSKYTGVPDISIPIYTIQTEGLEIPIRLKYHSNGIKVAEEASWVGLGWSLETVGSIVQVVNQYDDYGSYGSMAPLFEHPSFFKIPGGVSDETSKIIEYNLEQDVGIEGTALGHVNGDNWTRDAQPDVFKFSFLGYSGSFTYDRRGGSYVSLDNKNLKIQSDPPRTSTNSIPGNFIITVPEGHTFVFGLKSTTTLSFIDSKVFPKGGGGVGLLGHVTSRYYDIVAIYTNKGGGIFFGYDETDEILNQPSVAQTFINNVHDFRGEGPLAYEYFPSNETITSMSLTKQKNSYLKSITTDNVLIDFISTFDRKDMQGAKRLKNIIVKNNSTYNATLKSFELTYDYFTGHIYGNKLDSYLSAEFKRNFTKTDDEKSKRLMLTSVKENDLPAYQLIYNIDTQLPLKTSLAYDHWGFYNGKLTSTLQSRGSADEVSLQAGILNKIIYPTGGSTAFEYERNEIDDFNINPEFEVSTGSVNLFDNNYNTPYTNTNNNFVYATTISSGWLLVPEGGAAIKLYRSISLSGTGSCPTSNPTALPYYPNAEWQVVQYNADAAKKVEQNGWSAISSIVGNTTYKVKEEYGRINVGEPLFKEWDETLTLAPGVYFFSTGLNNACGPQTSTSNTAFAYLRVEYSITKLINTPTPFGAGLRVKSIANKNEAGTGTSLKQFKYYEPKLMSLPTYEYKSPFLVEYLWASKECQRENSANPSFCCLSFTVQGVTHRISTNSYFVPSTSAAGNYVGYGRVEELVTNPANVTQNNGKIVTTYQNEKDVQEADNVNLPLIKNNKTNGLVLTESIYDVNDNLLRSTEQTYDDVKQDCLWGMMGFWKESRIVIEDDVACVAGYHHIFNVGFYPIKRTETLLMSKKTTSFSNGVTQVNLEEYEYDGNNQLKSKKFTNSNGKIFTELYTYPYDQPADPVITEVINQNYIASPITVEKRINGNTIYFEQKDYQIIGYNYLFKPKTFFENAKISIRNNATDALRTQMEYQRFSGNKLLQYKGIDGVVVSLLWGYKNTCIVAKIIGATYDQVSPLVSALLLENPTSDAALQTELNKIRAALPNTSVTTYTHKPLVGVTTIVDPNGQIQSFEYDSNNRLKSVRDFNGNLVSEYKYNYFHY